MKIKILLTITATAFSALTMLNAQTTRGAQTAPVKPVYDSIRKWTWNPDATPPGWNLVQKTNRFIYDANKNNLKSITESYNPTDSTWQDVKVKTFRYDANGNTLSDATQARNFDNIWENTEKKIYTYNSQNKVSIRTEQIGATLGDTSVWVDRIRSTYTYDANGNQLNELQEYYSAGVWNKNRQLVRTYDSNNKLTLLVDQAWVNNSWSDQGKGVYTYDANGNLLVDENYTNDWGSWTLNYKRTNTYDAKNDKIEEITKTNAGTQGEKLTYTYNSNHKETSFLNQRWNNGKQEWVNFAKGDSYVFDGFGNRKSGVYYRYGSENFIKYETDSHEYNSDNLLYSQAYRFYHWDGHTTSGDSTYYHFHDFSTGIVSLDKNSDDLLVYPNPSNGIFTVKLLNNNQASVQQLEILNALGEQVVLQSNVNTINLTGLAKGIYFLKVQDKSQTYLKKVTLE